MSFLKDLANALLADGASTVLPVLVADLQAIGKNPPAVTDLVNLQIAGVKIFNDLLSAQPALSRDVVGETATLLATYISKIRIPAIAAAQGLPSAAPAASPGA